MRRSRERKAVSCVSPDDKDASESRSCSSILLLRSSPDPLILMETQDEILLLTRAALSELLPSTGAAAPEAYLCTDALVLPTLQPEFSYADQAVSLFSAGDLSNCLIFRSC